MTWSKSSNNAYATTDFLFVLFMH